MQKFWESHSVQETAVLAPEILDFCKNRRIFAIFGDLGAGKTTLIKAMCQSLGSSDNVTSPSFSIVNEYLRPEGKIFHFDLYRLKNSSELREIGFGEYVDSNEYVFIEWPEMASGLLPVETVKLELKHSGTDSRNISLFYA